MNKQIEEMAKIVCGACDFICDCEYLMKDKKAYTWCDLPKEVCEALCNAGYRKVNDDEVVISKQGFVDSAKLWVGIAKEVKDTNEETRKETAREILQELYNHEFEFEGINKTYDVIKSREILKLAEKYGVEVE